MPFLFQASENSPASSSSLGTQGFIVSNAPTSYGPGTIVLVSLLGIACVVYAAIFSFRVKVDGETQLLQRETSDLEISRDKKKEAEIFIFEKRMNALSRILRSHIYMSKVFPVLEGIAIPTVFYDSAKLSLTSVATPQSSGSTSMQVVKAELSGSTERVIDLARQMIVFRDDEAIKNGEMKNYELGKEGKNITFTAEVTLDGKIVMGNALPQ